MAKKKQTGLKAGAGILGTVVVLGLGFLKSNPEILSTVTGTPSLNQPAQSQQLKQGRLWQCQRQSADTIFSTISFDTFN